MAGASAHTDAPDTQRAGGGVSTAVMEYDAWVVADEAVAALPPLLRDDDLTAQSLFEKHKGSLTSLEEARGLLKELAGQGLLIEVECRSGRGHGRVNAYRLPEKVSP